RNGPPLAAVRVTLFVGSSGWSSSDESRLIASNRSLASGSSASTSFASVTGSSWSGLGNKFLFISSSLLWQPMFDFTWLRFQGACVLLLLLIRDSDSPNDSL